MDVCVVAKARYAWGGERAHFGVVHHRLAHDGRDLELLLGGHLGGEFGSFARAEGDFVAM